MKRRATSELHAPLSSDDRIIRSAAYSPHDVPNGTQGASDALVIQNDIQLSSFGVISPTSIDFTPSEQFAELDFAIEGNLTGSAALSQQSPNGSAGVSVEAEPAESDICLGLIQGGQIILSAIHQNSVSLKRHQVRLKSLLQGFALYTYDDAKYLALVNPSTAGPLARACSYPGIRLQAFLTAAVDDKKSKTLRGRDLDILVYSSVEDCNGIGENMSRNNLYLQHPSHPADICRPYRNPHYLIDPASQFPSLTSIIEGIAENDRTVTDELSNASEVCSQELFASSRGPETWSPVQQSSRLVTKLKEHQLKALAMMSEKEAGLLRHPDFPALWRPTENRTTNMTYRNVVNGMTKDYPQVGLGGVLADDMGLGKTLSTISLIVSSLDSLQGELEASGAAVEADTDNFGLHSTLILVPRASLQAWQRQFSDHLRPQSLKVCTYHGRDRSKLTAEVMESDVVLTTYGLLTKEYMNESGRKRTPSFLHSTRWLRLVFDEAHVLRNSSTQLFQAAMLLQAERRWCLTGTPIQNSIDDFGTLVQILRIAPYDNPGIFSYEIGAPIKRGEERAFSKLRRLVSTSCLRRSKAILDLPPREDVLVKVKLLQSERQLYDLICSGLLMKIDHMLEANELGISSLAYVMKQILRLRQICNHGYDLLPRALVESIFQGERSFFAANRDSAIICELCQNEVDDLMTDAACMHLVCQRCVTKAGRDDPEADGSCPLCNSLLPGSHPDLRAKAPTDLASGFPNKILQPSSKVVCLLQKLRKEQRDALPGSNPPKSVVFSEWTSMLDLVGKTLTTHGFIFDRVDGKKSERQWKAAIKNFFENPKCTILLASIKNAGLGIDLTAATSTHLLEPQWNPMVEEQALDRVHRLGQTKPVTMYRYIVQDSIENYVQIKQEQKLALIRASFAVCREAHATTVKEKLSDLKVFFSDHKRETVESGQSVSEESMTTN